MHPALVAILGLIGPTAADSLDACSLYTREEVTALSGDKATKPRAFSTDPANHSSCTTGTRTDQWTVKVYIERAPDKQVQKIALDMLKKTAGLKPVSGLGDEAYWGQVGPTNGQFHVILGLTTVSIQTWGDAPGAGTQEKTRPIAELVIKRYKERYGK